MTASVGIWFNSHLKQLEKVLFLLVMLYMTYVMHELKRLHDPALALRHWVLF
jgi:hypothetical protein